MVTVVLRILAALVLLVAPAASQETPPVELWTEIVDTGRAPHPQEMVILKVHGRYHVPVTLEKMTTPDMPGFRVVKVGRDRWIDVFEKGLTIRAFERTYAVYPQRSGRLEVPAFVHQLTILDRAMKHQVIEVPTAPVTLRVEPAPIVDGDWWLPASNLVVEERWTVAPENLSIGQSTRRTLTIRANGVFDDQLPPPPRMRADGLIIFPTETVRWTKLGLGQPPEAPRPLREQSLRKPELYDIVESAPAGPLSEVTYGWDVRPATDQPVTLPEIRIPWFDTASGRMREVLIPERTVALALLGPDTEKLERELGISGPESPPAEEDPLVPIATVGAGSAAFVLGLVTLLGLAAPDLIPETRARQAASSARRRAAREVRRRARQGDTAGLRQSIVLWARAGGDGAAAADAVRTIDRHLFGGEPPPDLVALTRALFARRRPTGSQRLRLVTDDRR